MESGLGGSVVLVTGGAGVLGTATCTALAAEGARVAVHYMSQGDRARALSADIDGAAYQADLSDETQAARLFESVRADFGHIDGCVALAGNWPEKKVPIAEMTVQEWHEFSTENLLITFLTVREYFRNVRSQGSGSLVLVGAASESLGHAGRGQFAAAKAAISYGLLRTLTDEITKLAVRGRVNSVSPGPVEAAGNPGQMESGERAMAMAVTALDEMPKPADVANAIVWLLSPRLSGSVTGQIIRVDSGLSGRVFKNLSNDGR